MLENKFGEPMPSRHTVGGANFHLQFTPKYRRKVFNDREIVRACKHEFERKASELGVTLYACEFGPDHVHLFIGNCKNYSLPKLAQHFKGSSSRALRRNLSEHVRQYEWGESFWSDCYFYDSIGRMTTENVSFYIERQQRKHWITQAQSVQKLKVTRRGQTALGDFAS